MVIHNKIQHCYGFQYKLEVGAHETTRAICSEEGNWNGAAGHARVNEIAVFGAAST